MYITVIEENLQPVKLLMMSSNSLGYTAMNGRRIDEQGKMWMEAITDILQHNSRTSAKITRYGLRILSQNLRI
jgi:hypothetical protein